MKKVMMATWSESEESSDEENEKEVANMCFIAIDDYPSTTCNFCGRGGHISSTCPLRNGSQKNSNAKAKKVWVEKSKVTNPQGPKKIWGSKKDKWFLDSGCSRHMTGDESKFAFLTKRNGGYVTFGDNSKGRIIGQGNIGLETSMGKLQIEDRRQQEEIIEDPKKEESPLALPPPQQVQGESSQDLPKDWKFVINHPQDQIIEFSKCMHSEFEMSMMGVLNFFLGLQIKQLKEGTFINQAKYIRDLLKRFNMEEAKTMKTLMSSSIKLDMDEKAFGSDFSMHRALQDWFSFISMAQGKHLAEPSQPQQTEACRKTRYDTALFNSIEDYQRYKQSSPGGKSS
ncbi:hypothetical protein AAG906_038444 [Vitis piasezkii]